MDIPPVLSCLVYSKEHDVGSSELNENRKFKPTEYDSRKLKFITWNITLRIFVIFGRYCMEQDRQRTYDVTLRRVRAAIVAGEKP